MVTKKKTTKKKHAPAKHPVKKKSSSHAKKVASHPAKKKVTHTRSHTLGFVLNNQGKLIPATYHLPVGD